jgi:dipeptidase E
MKKMMLLSNSKNPGGEFLDHVVKDIERFAENANNAIFFPFAGVTLDWDEYTEIVRKPFAELGIRVTGAHTIDGLQGSISQFDLILVGGGNTFRLLTELQLSGVIPMIFEQVNSGASMYIGWSAGSNVAGRNIKTTNDMPIVEPTSFSAIDLVPFNINPHFTDKTIPGHGGETRSQRLDEFLIMNPNESVVCIPEGSWIKVQDSTFTLSGQFPGIIRNHKYGDTVLQVGDEIVFPR